MAREINVRRAQKKFIILVCIFLVLLAVALYLHAEGFHIRDWKSFNNLPHSALLFITLYVLLSFLPIPLSVPAFTAGIVYTIYQAILYSFIGSIIFINCVFFITRYLGRDYIEYLTKNKRSYHKLEKSFEKNAFMNLVMLRFFFIIPSEIISLIGGLSEIRFSTFFTATLVGNIPLVVFTTMLVRSVITDNAAGVIVSIIALLCMLIIPFFAVPGIRKHISNLNNS